MGHSIREKSLEVMSGKKRAFRSTHEEEWNGSSSWVDLYVFPAQVWHSPDCSVPSRLFNPSLAGTDLGFTVAPSLQIRARSVCGRRGPGRQMWGTMRYVDKGLCSPKPWDSEPFQNSVFSLTADTKRLPSTRDSGTARTQEDTVLS